MRKKITWRLTITLAICTLLGFVQWDSWFSLEIRNEVLHDLAYGGLAFGALLLLICFWIWQATMLVKGWLLRIPFFLLSFLIATSVLVWFFAKTLPSRDWKDLYVYQNGDDYLVVQDMADPMFDMEYLWMVRTSNPTATVRYIEEQNTLSPGEETYSTGKDTLNFHGKIWRKIEVSK